jgi:rubrerythrin
MRKPIKTVEEFYAHALAIELEAAERYAEFEAYFRDRGEIVLAGLCGNIGRMEGQHFRELVAASRHLRLPAIDPGAYKWLEAGSPEAPAREFFYRVATPRHLLEVALQGEVNALAFFHNVALTSDSREVCALAQQMAEEEKAHVVWVRNALEYHPVDAGQRPAAANP